MAISLHENLADLASILLLSCLVVVEKLFCLMMHYDTTVHSCCFPVLQLLADSLHSPDKTPPNPLLLHTPQWVFTSEALLQWKGQVEEEDKKQRALLEQILDRSTAITLDEFDVQFSAYLKHLQLKRSKGLKIPLDPNHFKVPSLQVQTLLAERMAKEDRYWPSKQLCQVFQLQWIPYR